MAKEDHRKDPCEPWIPHVTGLSLALSPNSIHRQKETLRLNPQNSTSLQNLDSKPYILHTLLVSGIFYSVCEPDSSTHGPAEQEK